MHTHLISVSQMAYGGNLYTVKFRIRNYVYEEVLSADMFEDLRVRGIDSDVAKEVRDSDAKSLAIGVFKNPVEIMIVEPYLSGRETAMETEV